MLSCCCFCCFVVIYKLLLPLLFCCWCCRCCSCCSLSTHTMRITHPPRCPRNVQYLNLTRTSALSTHVQSDEIHIPKILEFKSKYQKHTAIIEHQDSVPNERFNCPLTLPRDPRTTNNNNKIRTKNIYLKKKNIYGDARKLQKQIKTA